ncbi:MAG: hypothetical protein HYY93_03515 [Planctomycetes bacterium]|nr:hypothetical protein [Planctomycetota bacterium]
MRWRRVAATSALAILLAGCVGAQVTRLGPGRAYAPVHVSEVQVFLADEDVPGPFEKLALIRLKADADWTDENDMVDKAKEEAAEMGANGIILGRTEDPGAVDRIAARIFKTPKNRKGEIVAIRFGMGGGGR